jgi:uncharacterized protein
VVLLNDGIWRLHPVRRQRKIFLLVKNRSEIMKGKPMPLDLILSQTEARVLGSLIEKELTTPESYPLSINSLVLACNQKSNREPVMLLTEDEVLRALDSLRSKQLAWQRSVAGARVLKYEHNIVGRWHFEPDEIATLCVLLLRGPQTAGEIKGRTGRMHEFPSLTDVESTIDKLLKREDGPFVHRLPRLTGHKESRFAHLLCGNVELPQEPETPLSEVRLLQAAGTDRISMLEKLVQEMGNELVDLKSQFGRFRKQFE